MHIHQLRQIEKCVIQNVKGKASKNTCKAQGDFLEGIYFTNKEYEKYKLTIILANRPAPFQASKYLFCCSHHLHHHRTHLKPIP